MRWRWVLTAGCFRIESVVGELTVPHRTPSMGRAPSLPADAWPRELIWTLDWDARAGLPQSSHGPVDVRLMLVGLSHWTLRWFVMKYYYSNRWLIPIVREVSLRGWYLSWDPNDKKPVPWWPFQAERTSNMRKKMQRWELAWRVQGTERRPMRLDDVRG